MQFTNSHSKNRFKGQDQEIQYLKSVTLSTAGPGSKLLQCDKV